MAKVISPSRCAGAYKIVENSGALLSGSLVSLQSGFVSLPAATDKVEWVAVDADKTYDADNQTVKQEKVNLLVLEDNTLIEMDVTNGTIAQANVGAVYDLVTWGASVDGATSATGVVLILEEVLSTTKGIFKRAK